MAPIERLKAVGLLQESRNRFGNAERCYERALAIVESEKNLPEIVAIKRSLARVCDALGKDAEALLLTDQAQAQDGLPDDGVQSAQPFGGSAGFWALLGEPAC